MRLLVAALFGFGCSASPAPGGKAMPTPETMDKKTMAASHMGGDPESVFGPLEVGADLAQLKKLTDEPFLSLDHGNRWVDVYANEIGAAPYLANEDIPVGSIFVKTSWQKAADGSISDVPGPTFIMKKRAPGYAPDTGDWWYAIHWPSPPEKDAKKFGGPIYWRGKSKRVQYCLDCHDSYNNSLGGLVPSSILKR